MKIKQFMEVLDKERDKRLNWSEGKFDELIKKELQEGLSEAEEKKMNYCEGFSHGVLSLYDRLYEILNKMEEEDGE